MLSVAKHCKDGPVTTGAVGRARPSEVGQVVGRKSQGQSSAEKPKHLQDEDLEATITCIFEFSLRSFSEVVSSEPVA